MNAKDCHKALNKHLLPVSDKIWDHDFIFQQDNAPIHSTNSKLVL